MSERKILFFALTVIIYCSIHAWYAKQTPDKAVLSEPDPQPDEVGQNKTVQPKPVTRKPKRIPLYFKNACSILQVFTTKPSTKCKDNKTMENSDNSMAVIGMIVLLIGLTINAIMDVLKVKEEERIRRKLNPDGERRQSLAEFANKKPIRRESSKFGLKLFQISEATNDEEERVKHRQARAALSRGESTNSYLSERTQRDESPTPRTSETPTGDPRMVKRRSVSKIFVLHWNYRGFTEFPLQQLHGEETVTDIYLKENLISSLPNDIGRLERLESLYLSGNDITELPREISRLRCLKCLDVSGNRLKRLPEEIGDVISLKFLILDDNELVELPLRLAELRTLRYLSVCDNRLRWLPQRPVYNYFHCEFRFWRNTELKTIPYSLWYNMLRDQQTRSLNIGCLSVPQYQHLQRNARCRLKLQYGSRIWEVDVDCPPQYTDIIESGQNTPPSLYELSRRTFYETVSEAARTVSIECYSIYGDHVYYEDENNNDVNNNDVSRLERNFNNFDIIEDPTLPFDTVTTNNVNRNDSNNIEEISEVKRDLVKRIDEHKGYCIVGDIIKEYCDFIPQFMKSDVVCGPVSRCENVKCKAPIFDFVTYEFCLGKIILIDNTEDVILSAAFCSQSCANVWKGGKTNVIIPWKLSPD